MLHVRLYCSNPPSHSALWSSLFLYVGLGLLVLLLIIIIIAWKVWDKHKKNMAMNQNPGYTELTLNLDHEYAVIDRTGIIKGDPAEQLNPDHEYANIDRTDIIKGDPAEQLNPDHEYDVIDRTGIIKGDPAEQLHSPARSTVGGSNTEMLLYMWRAAAQDESCADSVSSVGRVSMQSGRSVTIPCSYEDSYKTHVKYWCRGSGWSSCTSIVRTDFPRKKDEVSIRDDPDQRVFTVTMNNLQTGVSDYYWCSVEISGGSAVGTRVYLSVTEGSPELTVDKPEMTGVEGDSVSVQCHSEYSLSWCRMGGSCITRSSGLNGRPVLIRVDRVNKVITVTMRGLERKDTGWYWCDYNGYQQIPVHITVNLRTATTTSAERKY
ncbi:polymeric immunoglobulin receptor-like [Paramormyrops kingsleyae]|uniref:polymeric immunoglobulin receptor-like n=1 Tax=Paramormyrops kingsleyae TaxID=1676925 RepID=UPI003B96A67A